MVNTFAEVKISLTLGIGNHLELVLLVVVWSVDINSFFQVHECLSQCPASKRAVVEPCEEVSSCDVVVEDVL